MRCSLRNYLSTPNPQIAVPPGISSRSRSSNSWGYVSGWVPWTDFTADNVNVLLGNFLDQEFDFPEPPPLSPSHLDVRVEKGLEFVLIRWNNIIVNAALDVICQKLGFETVTWNVGWPAQMAGGRDSLNPDWAGVISTSPETNLLPGDTKITGINFLAESAINYDSEGFSMDSSNDPKAEYMRACFEQTNFYASRYKSRYNYILTNHEVILIRLSRAFATPRAPVTRSMGAAFPSSPPGLTTTSTRKWKPSHSDSYEPPTTPSRRGQSPARYARIDQTSPQLPRQSSSLQRTSSPTVLHPTSSAYTDDELDFDLPKLEVVTVPWNSQNDGLSINMSLVLLHLLAYIACDIREGYISIHEDQDYQNLGSLDG